MEEELKPCPFCGHKPTWQLTKKKNCQMHGDEYQDHILLCASPHCPIHPRMLLIGPNKESLREAWNTRA